MLSMLQASENGQRAEQQMPPFKFEYLKQAYFVAYKSRENQWEYG